MSVVTFLQGEKQGQRLSFGHIEKYLEKSIF